MPVLFIKIRHAMDQIKFIGTDMDGTLLNNEKQLPKDFYSVFQALKEKGILFAAASGRQFQSLEQTFLPIKDDIIFISDNGALVMYQGKEISSTPMLDIEKIVKVIREIEGAHIVISGKKAAYVETQNARALAEIVNYYKDPVYTPDLLTIDDEFIKLAVLHFDGTAQHVFPIVEPLFAQTHQVVVSAEVWLDLMDMQTSKGAAIRKLQQHFGFTYEQTMSFGDYFNDVELLKESYHSYAMENAQPEIKALARFRAPSNEEQGVMKVIKEKVLLVDI